MKIIFIHKAELHKRPPVISAVMILADLGYEVTLITCGISEKLLKTLNSRDIDTRVLSTEGKLNKITNYIKFRKNTKRIIKSIYRSNNDTILWIEGAQTILALSNILRNYPYVLQIQELHEDSRIQLLAISKVVQDAKAIFMPEYNRTVIYQIWFNLNKRPYVLPNKPYFIPNKPELEKLKKKYKVELEKFEGKKVILYQGGISKVRMLENLAKALNNIDDDFILLLLGSEHEVGYIKKLKSLNNKIIHIPFIPAPDYLVFSTISYIGYVMYAPTSLNNAYCAPNKINEYSAFSLPMIGNNIPGLKTIFEVSNSGIIVDENSVDSIEQGIKKIDANYQYYRGNAGNIFRSSDNKSTIRNVLNNIK